jgi:NAD(P)-dependent dehydrogenase (short-subunit alcohol dehydrogenase family)
MKIEGTTALVTGANGGIGKHYIEALQAAGAARIYAGARNPDSLAEIAATDPDRIIPVPLDIIDRASVQGAAARCQDVSLLINNAGIAKYRGLIAAPDLSSARAEMEVNYFGTLEMCRAFAPILKANGGGAIINMQSIIALVNFPKNGGYSASRAASLSMTQGIRAELAAQGTLVVAVLPGTVDTSMSKNDPPPKVSPAEVTSVALQAVIESTEEVYPGEQAKEMAAKLLKDPKSLEKWMATMLPTS